MDVGSSSTSPGHTVQVDSRVWARDSHDLFDFEAQQVYTNSMVVSGSMQCVQTDTNVEMVSENAAVAPGSNPLLRVVNKDGVFWVDKTEPANSCRKLWLVVRDLAGSGYRLVEGDIIKLGRFNFRVRQLVTSACRGTQPVLKLDDDVPKPQVSLSSAELSEITCRICLFDGQSSEDPLVSPCLCKGSIEYVHLGCLRHWIKSRLKLSDTSSGGSCFYHALTCELCKAVYPTHVQVGADRVPLVEVLHTQPPFIVLENMARDSDHHAIRSLHVISLAEKALKLGRGHESDIRIADVSISRCHATISFHQGQFLLQDNNSKFGTLIALKKARPLEAGRPISIQMGRTILALKLQPDPNLALPPVHCVDLESSDADEEQEEDDSEDCPVHAASSTG